MRYAALLAALLSSAAWATSFNLVSSQPTTTNYGATVYICTYASAQGQMFSVMTGPGQTCQLAIIR